MLTRRKMILNLMTGMGLAVCGVPLIVRAEDWREKIATLNFGVVSSENEADRIARYKTFVAYMERTMRAPIKMHQATDYAGTIEALKARKLEFARFGPAAYAQAWLVTGGKVEPIVVETDGDGFVGYHAVVVVKVDSPFQVLDDLRGKSFAFADPNSTSGYIAPVFFLREEGTNPETFFGRTGFSGSHENSIIAVLNGTYDAAATWWTNAQRSNVARMEGKGLIPQGQLRYIWKSPKLPGSPWAVRTDLPTALKEDIKAALVALPTEDPGAWKELTDGKNKGVQESAHADYDPVIRMIKDNQRSRRDAKSK
jgi:phosphonate transport system substrate-binding protein